MRDGACGRCRRFGMRWNFSREFSPEEMAKIRQGFLSASMDDPWFLDCREGRLHFHRGITGNRIFVLEFSGARIPCRSTAIRPSTGNGTKCAIAVCLSVCRISGDGDPAPDPHPAWPAGSGARFFLGLLPPDPSLTPPGFCLPEIFFCRAAGENPWNDWEETKRLLTATRDH